MRRFLLAILLTTFPVGAAPRKPTAIEQQVDRYLQPFVQTRNFTGAVLLAKDGKILVSKGYGMANYELRVPNSAQTAFHIASVSKPFTAASILLLEERGRLSTDDPLSKYIPDYPNGNRILLRHLLTHTSGIPNVNDFPRYDADSRFPHTLEQLIAMFKKAPLDFQPGQKYAYSNSNYNLLAYVIELVSKKSYGEFLRENIFAPLGMTGTGDDSRAGALIPNRAEGYEPAGLDGLANAPYLDWSNKTGNGSLYSTVDDLYKFDRALSGDKLLSRRSLDKMFAAAQGSSYGWFNRKRFGKRVNDATGRSPGFTAAMERFPDDNATVIVLSNSYAPTSQTPVSEDLAAMLWGQKYEPPRLMPVVLDASALDRYTGTYRFGPDFVAPNAAIKFTREGDHLLMEWSPTFKSVLAPLSNSEFLDRSIWARVVFEPGQVIYRYTQNYLGKKQ